MTRTFALGVRPTNLAAVMDYDGTMERINPHLDVTHEQIADYCRRWNIVRFELFGSVLRDDFRPDSDVDVLVTFAPNVGYGIGELLDMEDELKALFGRDVDLVKRDLVERSENYIRRRSILNSAQSVYAA
jgi:predicted nucleotidyltransferase